MLVIVEIIFYLLDIIDKDHLVFLSIINAVSHIISTILVSILAIYIIDYLTIRRFIC